MTLDVMTYEIGNCHQFVSKELHIKGIKHLPSVQADAVTES